MRKLIIFLFTLLVALLLHPQNVYSHVGEDERVKLATEQRITTEKLEQLTKSIDLLKLDLKNANQEITTLKESSNKTNSLLKIAGITSLASLLALIVGYFWWIRKRVIEVIKDDSPKYIIEEAKKFVIATLDNDPVIKKLRKRREIKLSTSILVLSKDKPSIDFIKYLKEEGFERIKGEAITNFKKEIDNDYQLILFDNGEHNLRQENLSQVVNSFKDSVRYMYYCKDSRNFGWKNDGISDEIAKKINIGYANSIDTLEDNIFKKIK